MKRIHSLERFFASWALRFLFFEFGT